MEYHGEILVANSDLYHHGILGQKWGRKNGPPYPLGTSDHSAAEKKAGWRKSLDGKSKGGLFRRKKKVKKNQAAVDIAQERLKTMQTENPELYEATKATALQKGKASDVLQFKGNLTNQQLQDAVNRIRLEQTLSEFSSKEVKSNWDKVDSAMKHVRQVADWAKTTSDLFENADKIYKKIGGGNSQSTPNPKKK